MRSTFIVIWVTMFLCGCKLVTFDVYEHPETARYHKQFETVLPKDVFKKHPEFTDLGIFFIPYTRYLGWEPDYRTFINFYAKEPKSIWIDRIEVSSDQKSLAMEVSIQKNVEINEIEKNTSLLRNSVAAFFRDLENVEEILVSESVDLIIYYKTNLESKELRKMVFHLIRVEETDIAWPT